MQFNFCFLFLIFMLQHTSQAQIKTYKIPDSLLNKDIIYCKSKALSINDTAQAIYYTQVWIELAKWKVNWGEQDEAYRKMVFLKPMEQRLQYTDSIIIVANNSKNTEQIAKAYLTKGVHLQHQKKYTLALENYINASKFLDKTKDNYNKYKVRYAIASLKYHVGDYKEALETLNDCLQYFQVENERAYLNALHLIGLCYRNLNEYEWASQINKLGIQAGKDFENNEMKHYFLQAEGINLYFKGKYKQAIDQLSEVIIEFDENKDVAERATSWSYIGKAYWKINQKGEAIKYFEKVNQAFVLHNYTHPELRENYEWLLKYYKEENNLNKQWYYINQILQIDSIVNSEHKLLAIKLVKEYETPQLIKEKEKIAAKMQNKNDMFTGVLGILLISSTVLGIKYKESKKQYKQKFKSIMNNESLDEFTKKRTKEHNLEELNIHTEVIDRILKKLDLFEKTNRYIEKDMNLNKIASLLETNTKYASKIIVKYKNKKTIDYISDLKIDYLIKLLKEEKKYRNYTTQALGELVGFGSTQNFSKAFKDRTGLAPSYFINELKKTKEQ
jgi:YesN/AraC family two-component response regulator